MDTPQTELAPEAPPLEARAPEETRPKPRLWTVLTAMIAVVATTEGLRKLWMMWAKLPRRSDYGDFEAWAGSVLRSPWGPAVIVLPFQLSLIAAIALAVWMHRGHARERLGWVAPRVGAGVWGHVLLGWFAELLTGLGLLLLVAALFHWTPPPRASTNLLLEGIGEAHGVARFGWWFAVALLPAVCEETFYRGIVQRRLLERIRPAVAITITAVIFAAFHVDRILEVTPLAFYLGWLAWRFNSVIPGVLVHLANNSMIFGLMSAMPRGAHVPAPTTLPPSMLPFGIVMAGLGLALLIRSLRAIQAGTTVTLETTTST